jgi:hypothetical protein
MKLIKKTFSVNYYRKFLPDGGGVDVDVLAIAADDSVVSSSEEVEESDKTCTTSPSLLIVSINSTS